MAAPSDKQMDLLRAAWGLTVERAKALDDAETIAAEWLALHKALDDMAKQALARHRLHA